MSFVGTRPEVTKYVKKYTKEMRATLLLPAGITSEASIMISASHNIEIDQIYSKLECLPKYMKRAFKILGIQ